MLLTGQSGARLSLAHSACCPSSPMSSHHYSAARHNKRKRQPPSSQPAALSSVPTPAPAPARRERLSNLPWKSLSLPSEITFDDEGGLLELDEVDGVDVVYDDNGVLSFQVGPSRL